MLIKPKNPPKATELQVQEVPQAPILALEDIDYITAAYELADARMSLESVQTDIEHGGDIAASLEQLDMVLESLAELDMNDAALIHAVGDIAGASCGMSGRLFTPSLEDVDDSAPSLQNRIKTIYEMIVKYVRILVSKIGAYVAAFFAESHHLATNFQNLGDKIRGFNFNDAQVVSMYDLKGAVGGPKSLIPALAAVCTAAQNVVNIGPSILATQLNYIQLADKKGIDGVFEDLQTIQQMSLSASRGLTMSENGDESNNPVLISKPFINGVMLRAQVFDYDAAGKDFSSDLIRRAFRAQIGFVNATETSEPKISTFTMSHELAKDCYDALRPLVTMMVDQSSPQSFYKVLKDLRATCEGLDQWLHTRKQHAEAGSNQDPRLVQLYQQGIQSLGTSQLAALVKTHTLLCGAATVVMDYISSSLKAPSAPKPQRAAVPSADMQPVTSV